MRWSWTSIAVAGALAALDARLGAHGAARYLRSGKGQSWFNRISAGLFSGAGAASLLSR